MLEWLPLDFKKLKEQWLVFWKSGTGKITSKVLQYLFIAGIIGYLVFQLTEIGWLDVWQSLPINPWFYVLFLILYFALPISEQFIYRLSLDFSFWEGFKIFVRKKVLNTDVMGYSGEALFYFWGKKNLDENNKDVLKVIKDNNIISSIASTLTAIILLSIFLYVGQVNLSELFDISALSIGLGIFIAIMLVSLGVYFRKYIISMNTRKALKIFGIHEARIIVVYTLEVLQWSIVLPDVPLYIWLTYLSVKIIASRLPFIPSQDLLFVSISIGVSKYLGVDGAAIAGILLTNNVLSKILNFIFYISLSVSRRLREART